MRSKITRALALVILALATTQVASALSGTQLLSYTDANADTTDFVCTAGCPANSAQLMTQSQFSANYNHGANTCGTNSTTQLIGYDVAMACKTGTSSSQHTPILANNSFASASFTSWNIDAAVYTGACTTSTVFVGAASPDQDADGGGSVGSTGNLTTGCFHADASTVTLGLTQTVSIAGTPTSQSYSFYYYSPGYATAGDPSNCVGDTGTVSNLVVKINGVTQQTIATPIVDAAWHQVSGSTSALINGSNTIDILVTLAGAHGTALNASVCTAQARASQTFSVDKVVLNATY